LSGPVDIGSEVHIGGITFCVTEMLDDEISELLVVTQEVGE